MKLVVGATTDVGQVRDGNEDTFLVDDRLRLFAVADGMGGHRAGEVASTTAIEALRAAVAQGHLLDDAILEANRAVFEKASGDESLSGMGTTLTALGVGSEHLVVIGHVGDSRAYLARDSELTQITDDHSLVEEMVREGRITQEQALVHPQRSIITRALGIDEEIDVDLYPVELEAGDRLLICSDGLTSMVRTDDIARILRREPDPQRAADALADAANAAGGEDNVTAVVITALADDAVAEAGSTVVDTTLPLDTDGSVDHQAAPSAGGSGTAATSDTRQIPAEVDDAALGGVRRIDSSRPAATPVVGGIAAAPPPDTAAAAAAAAQSQALRRGRVRGTSRSAFRFLWWILPIVLISVVAIGAVGWYARRSFYVAIDRQSVIIYRGVPGGLFGWNPTVEHRTPLKAADLTTAQRVDLRDGHSFSSKSGAEQFVARISATTTTTTTTTRVPAVIPAPTPAAPPAT